MEEVESIFNSAVDSISSKFGFQEFDLNNLGSSSSAPDDITEDYEISGVGTLKLKFFDTKYLIQGVEFFRPIIRGFLILLTVLFSWRMFLSFIGHDLGAAAYNSAKAKKGD